MGGGGWPLAMPVLLERRFAPPIAPHCSPWPGLASRLPACLPPFLKLIEPSLPYVACLMQVAAACSSCMAFAVNLSIFLVIGKTSPVT